MIRTNRAVLAVCAGALVWGSAVGAQSARTFKTRLSPVPIDITMQATVAGSGSVSAVLTGTKLTVTGALLGEPVYQDEITFAYKLQLFERKLRKCAVQLDWDAI